MKKFILLVLLVSSILSFGQTPLCDCSGPLSKDLATITHTSEYRNLKEFLYIYFKSDSTTQTIMKNDHHYNWSSNAEAVVDGIPVKGTGNADIQNSEMNQIYNRLEQTYQKNSYLSDEQFNEFFTTTMSDNQLKGYLGCLDLCKNILANGITSNSSGDFKNEFSIQISFKSVPSGQKTSLKGDAVYPNLEPIGVLVFKNGLEIKDGQTVIQYFKRLDPTKAASFAFNLNDGVHVDPLNFPALPNVSTDKALIGTIVASVLKYKAFLEANGLIETNDMSKAIWVPCDGRSIPSSQYSKFGNVPDLRGVFLRCVNDYSVDYDGVSVVAPDHANPENKKAGDFQGQSFLKHAHSIPGPAKTGPGIGGNANNFMVEALPRRDASATDLTGGDETRPVNVTVYYYIKVN